MESPAKPGFLSDSSPRRIEFPKGAVSKHLARELALSIWSKEPSSGLESSYLRSSQGNCMEHPRLRHPEFGLLCPPPRLLRELRIAFTFLLIGGVGGALCVSEISGSATRWQSKDR